MANNYTDTSVTFVPRDATQPFALGPIGTAVVTALTAWYDVTDGTAFVADESSRMESHIAATCLEVAGVEFSNPVLTFVEAITAIHTERPDMVTKDMLDVTLNYFGRPADEPAGDPEWETLDLDSAFRPFMLEPGSNCSGMIEESSWRCDRNRHGEFGGAAWCKTDQVSRGVSTSSVISDTLYVHDGLRVFDTNPDPVVAYYKSRVNDVFQEIVDVDKRTAIQTAVLKP
jgi:hypothetical protein